MRAMIDSEEFIISFRCILEGQKEMERRLDLIELRLSKIEVKLDK